jgi:hypothetical protein
MAKPKNITGKIERGMAWVCSNNKPVQIGFNFLHIISGSKFHANAQRVSRGERSGAATQRVSRKGAKGNGFIAKFLIYFKSSKLGEKGAKSPRLLSSRMKIRKKEESRTASTLCASARTRLMSFTNPISG